MKMITDKKEIERLDEEWDGAASSPVLLRELRQAQANTREKLRGGARVGSGRKALDKKPMTVRLSAAARARLEELSQAQGRPLSVIIEDLIARA